MANQREVYSIYVLAYAQREARPYGEFDKTLASSLGCIHARSEKMLMPSELAARLREMGAESDTERDDDCDVGPSARDRRLEADAHERLLKLVLAGGHVETGGRSLYESAGDEIVRLNAELDLAQTGAGRWCAELQQAKEALTQTRAKVEELRSDIACNAKRVVAAREQGAAAMRERAADAIRRMKNGIKDIMARTALQDAVNAVRALPLSGAPATPHPLDVDACERRKSETFRALDAAGVPFGEAMAGASAAAGEQAGLSAEDAETLRASMFWSEVEPGVWERWGRPGARWRVACAADLAGLRAAARQHRDGRGPSGAHLSPEAPAPARGTPGKATGAEAAEAGKDSVAEEPSGAQGALCDVATAHALAMLRRAMWNKTADRLESGEFTPQRALAKLRAHNEGKVPDADDAAAMTALEALDRGDLCGARDHVGLAAVITRVTRERDAAIADGAALRGQLEGALKARDEARAEAAALGKEIERRRNAWSASELSELRREHQTDREDEPRDRVKRWGARRDRIGVELQRSDLTAFARGYLTGCCDTWGSAEVDLLREQREASPLRPAEDIARELIPDAAVNDFTNESEATLFDVFTAPASQSEVDDLRRAITSLIERSRAEGKRAAVEPKEAPPGMRIEPAQDGPQATGSASHPEALTNADGRVTLIVRDKADAREVAAACVELLGLSSDEVHGGNVVEAFDAGVAEGERRAKAKAAELTEKWTRRVDRHEDQAEADAARGYVEGQHRYRGRAGAVGVCVRDIRKTFGIEPVDPGKPPTGEPAPEASEVVAPPATAAVPADWTMGPDGRANTSPRFEALCDEVARLIRGEAHSLIGGHTRSTAGLIMAQLAHVHGLAPRDAAPYPASPPGAPDRDTLGRAVLAVLHEWTPTYTTTWEQQSENGREHDRLVGERLFNMGVQWARQNAAARAEPEAQDERWQPGAVWEHRSTAGNAARFELVSVLHGRARFFGGLSFAVSAMTEANGWRYVGPAKAG